MKILFLDIDGVLNSERSSFAFNGYPHDFSAHDMALFDHVAVALVRKLCAVTGCVIVLSSTWRLNFTAAQAAEALDLPIIDRTPDLGSYDTRSSEVSAWLAEHPEVTSYAIVDDVPVFDDPPANQSRFVQTDPAIGMTLDTYRALCFVLATPLSA